MFDLPTSPEMVAWKEKVYAAYGAGEEYLALAGLYLQHEATLRDLWPFLQVWDEMDPGGFSDDANDALDALLDKFPEEVRNA